MAEKIKSFLTIKLDKENDLDANNYDAAISIALLLFFTAAFYLFGYLIYKTDFAENYSIFFNNILVFKILVGLFLPIVLLVPVFIVLKLKKQPLISVGIGKKNFIKSIILGLIFSLPLVLPTIIGAIVNQYAVVKSSDIALYFIYHLVTIAFAEEVYFRGFLFTRLKGFIKGKWLRIIVCGIAFGLLHMPFLYLNSGMTITEFTANYAVNMIYYMLTNIYMVFIYSKTNNIFAPVIVHTLNNLMVEIFIVL